MGGCVAWPAARQPVTDVHPDGTPPIMVIGNTGDPNTPLIGAKHLAAIFRDASLLTWTGGATPGCSAAPATTACRQAVTTYLSGGGLPPIGHGLPLTGCITRTGRPGLRSTARRGHSAAARVANAARSSSTGAPSTIG